MSNDIAITEDERLINLTKLLPVSKVEITAEVGGIITASIELNGVSLLMQADLVTVGTKFLIGYQQKPHYKEIESITFKDGTTMKFQS